MARARSKAWISATQQIPSTEHLHRMTHAAGADLGRLRRGVSPEAVFPGAGGMPVLRDGGIVVAGIAASGATVSPFLPPGVAPEVVQRRRSSRPTPRTCSSPTRSAVPYVGQHGDDRARWSRGSATCVRAARGQPRACSRRPAATQQAELDWARRARATRCIAAGRGRRASRLGRRRRPAAATRSSRTGWTTPSAGGVDVALATAAAAARFGMRPAASWPSVRRRRAARRTCCRSPFLARCPAGVPLVVDGRVVGGPRRRRCRPVPVCAELAAEVAGRARMTVRVARPRLRRDRQPVRRPPRPRRRRRGLGRRPVGRARRRPSTRDGLRVTGQRRLRRARARAAPTPPTLPPCDFGIVATKAQHTRAAVGGLRRRPRRRGRRQRAERAGQRGGHRRAGAARHPRHASSPPVRSPAPGVVRYDAPGDSWLGPFEPSPASIGRDRRARRTC